MPLRASFSTALFACLAAPLRAAGRARRGLMPAIWALVMALTVFTVEHPALAEDFEEEVEAELSIGNFAAPDGGASLRLSSGPGDVPVAPQAPGELPDMDLTLPAAPVLPARVDVPPLAAVRPAPEPHAGPLLRPPIA